MVLGDLRKAVLFALALLFAVPALAAEGDAGLEAFNREDYQTAMEEWQPLAESGNAAAQYNLAVLFKHGLGVLRDDRVAVNWFSKSAEQGDPDAQYEIGNYYLDGYWEAPNPEQAAIWYGMAAEQGHAAAAAQLSEIEGGGTTGQLAAVPRQPAENFSGALAPDCSPTQGNDFSVRVGITIPEAPINRQYSSAQLTQQTFHGRSGSILGLMVPDLDIKTDGDYAGHAVEGGYCFWVNGVDIELRYNSVEIFIASDYGTRSCNYREILKHEKEHVRIARANLERYKPKVRYALTSLLIPKSDSPVKVASKEAAEAELRDLFGKLLKPVYQDMIKDLRRTQHAIDTPQSYRRVHDRCDNW